MTVAKAPSLSTLQWARVGLARRFIRAHATEALSLERIAREASTSPFHFSRMFRALTGETVFQHVTRVRLKRAVALLVEQSGATVTDIAGRVGYESAPSFNKLFRKALGTTPTRFRALAADQRAALLARLDDPDTAPSEGLDVADVPEIRERPDRRFFFVRLHGHCPDEAPRAWAAFHRIEGVKALARTGAEFIGASYEDAGSATEASRRYEAGLAVAEGRAPRGLESGVLAGGRYAVFRYRGDYAHIGRAFDAVFRRWVSESGAALRPAPCLEIYVDNESGVAPRDRLTELCVPIET